MNRSQHHGASGEDDQVHQADLLLAQADWSRRPQGGEASGQDNPGRGEAGQQAAGARGRIATQTAKPAGDELRALVAKLQRGMTKLQSAHKELVLAGQEAEERIAALEAEIARLSQPARQPAAKVTRPRKKHEIDPGDAVPPGVAVEQSDEPAEPDLEAETARENLEEHLAGE